MLGDQLLLARKHAGIRQVDAAAHAHITQPYLSMVEHNLHTPSPPIMQRLLRLYGLTPGAEADEQDAPPPRAGGPRVRCRVCGQAVP